MSLFNKLDVKYTTGKVYDVLIADAVIFETLRQNDTPILGVYHFHFLFIEVYKIN